MKEYCFDEFETAKIAFQMGYTNVYYNEDGEQKPTFDKWLIDSVAVGEFVSDFNIERIETNNGDWFNFTPQQAEEMAEPIRKARLLSVNDLLAEHYKNNGQ